MQVVMQHADIAQWIWTSQIIFHMLRGYTRHGSRNGRKFCKDSEGDWVSPLR